MARSTPPTAATLTIAEYERLQEGDEYRSELVRGVLVREPRPAPYHAHTQALLARHLVGYVEREKLGWVLTDVGVVLSRRPPTVRGPDLAFYGRERLPELPRDFLEVPPDLAVEVLSPSNTVSEVLEKVMEYLDAGTRLVWTIDPSSRTATVYRSRDDIRILTEGEALDGRDVLPGLRLPLADVLPQGSDWGKPRRSHAPAEQFARAEHPRADPPPGRESPACR